VSGCWELDSWQLGAGTGDTNVTQIGWGMIAWIRKEATRPLDRLSVGAGVVCAGTVYFAKRWGLSLVFYGLIFRGLPWTWVRATAFLVILVLAFIAAMRPIWKRQCSRIPAILTVFAVLLLSAKAIVAVLLVALGLVFYCIVGFVIRLFGPFVG